MRLAVSCHSNTFHVALSARGSTRLTSRHRGKVDDGLEYLDINRGFIAPPLGVFCERAFILAILTIPDIDLGLTTPLLGV